MKYKDILITPEDLLDPDDPTKLLKNREWLNIACMSLTIELRPLELLTAIKLIGQKNIEIMSFRYSTLDELYSDTGKLCRVPDDLRIDHTISNSKEVLDGVATMAPFGARIYTCRLFFRGEGIFRLTGMNTSNICYRDKDDENQIIINAEAMIFNNFMSEVYNEIFNELSEWKKADDDGSVYKNKIYGKIRLRYKGFYREDDGRIVPPTVPVLMRYVVTPLCSVDVGLGGNLALNNLKKIPEFRGFTQCNTVNVIFNVTIPIAYLPMVYLLRPSWATILKYDRIVPYASENIDNRKILAELYTGVSESSPLNLVIMADAKEALKWSIDDSKESQRYFLEVYKTIALTCDLLRTTFHII